MKGACRASSPSSERSTRRGGLSVDLLGPCGGGRQAAAPCRRGELAGDGAERRWSKTSWRTDSKTKSVPPMASPLRSTSSAACGAATWRLARVQKIHRDAIRDGEQLNRAEERGKRHSSFLLFRSFIWENVVRHRQKRPFFHLWPVASLRKLRNVRHDRSSALAKAQSPRRRAIETAWKKREKRHQAWLEFENSFPKLYLQRIPTVGWSKLQKRPFFHLRSVASLRELHGVRHARSRQMTIGYHVFHSSWAVEKLSTSTSSLLQFFPKPLFHRHADRHRRPRPRLVRLEALLRPRRPGPAQGGVPRALL